MYWLTIISHRVKLSLNNSAKFKFILVAYSRLHVMRRRSRWIPAYTLGINTADMVQSRTETPVSAIWITAVVQPLTVCKRCIHNVLMHGQHWSVVLYVCQKKDRFLPDSSYIQTVKVKVHIVELDSGNNMSECTLSYQ